MSASANADSDASVPCATPNCGFWGRPSTGNFCSRCYKEKTNQLKEKKPDDKEANEKKIEIEQVEKVENKSSSVVEQKKEIDEEKVQPKSLEQEATESKAEAGDDGDKGSKKRKQKNRMRCFECRKKVGLTGIECECGFVFCGIHRYPENHSCDFDFKAQAKEMFSQRHTGNSAVVDKIIGEKL